MKLTKANTRILESLLPRLNLNVEEPERTDIERRLQADLYEAQRLQKPFETVHGQSPEERLNQMIAEIPELRRVETSKAMDAKLRFNDFDVYLHRRHRWDFPVRPRGLHLIFHHRLIFD